QIGVGFVGAAHVRIADDFDQRSAATIQIDVRIPIRIAKTLVQALTCVVLHMYSRDAQALGGAVEPNVDETVFRQRLIVLRDLVPLGQVGIKVVLASKA